MIYNAEQTTDRAKVEALLNKGSATNALTGDAIKYRANAITLTASAAKFPTNKWLSDKEVEILALTLKPNATPVSHKWTVKPSGREETRVFYNIADVANPQTVADAAKLYPVSAASGQAFSGDLALTLLRAAIANKYKSPFWTTLAGAEMIGLQITDVNAGVSTPVSVRFPGSKTFFNAAQTNNPAKVETAAYKAKFQPRSAMSGGMYNGPAQTVLSTAAMENRHSSVYWLTRKQATFLGVEIMPGEKPTEIATDEGSIRLFNASQTNSKDAIRARFTKNKAF